MTEAELLAAYGAAMSEDDLLAGIQGAMTVYGWRWTHIRRSDAAITQGSPGWPDLFAIHDGTGTMIALELKSATGRPTLEQLAWLESFRLAGVDARLVRPADYDGLLEYLRTVDRRP